MSKKHKKVGMALNYIEESLILVCISLFHSNALNAFQFRFCFISWCSCRYNLCNNYSNKKHKSVIKQKEQKKEGKIVLLAIKS